MGCHDHALRLTDGDHDFVVVFGAVQQPPELAHRIVCGAPVFTGPPAVMLRGLPVLTSALTIHGCTRTSIGRTSTLTVDRDGLVVRRDGVTAFGHLISLVCYTISFRGDFIARFGTLIITCGDPVPMGEIVELVASHSHHVTHGPRSASAIA